MRKMIRCMVLVWLLLYIPVRGNASEWGVPVGGINILKTDVTGNPLKGAVFQIARELREGELTDHNIEKQFLRIGDENRIMAMESFWKDRDMAGEKQTEVKTDEEGKAAVYGLSYGTYYLVEREAPTGYNRIISPIRVSVHKYSHLTKTDNVRDDNNALIDNTIHIINVRYTLPDTGSWGTIQLAAAGTGVIFSSVALILLNRKRWY